MTTPAVRDASWTPTIEQDVQGSRGERGILLRAPASEALAWDLETEIVSTRCRWIEERQAWWIASSYFETVVSIVLRSFGSVLVIGLEEDRLLSRDGRVALQGRFL
ncbi:MAG: hypothetical protein GEU90_02535 [Gemmatimonas sp.]|nr:hypothetical protein [Gemmatimonas sp.]